MDGLRLLFFFFFNDTATTEIYTLSLHDALPIWSPSSEGRWNWRPPSPTPIIDRKSTRLNSSHLVISYAVFCLKKKQMMQTMAGGLIRTALASPVRYAQMGA